LQTREAVNIACTVEVLFGNGFLCLRFRNLHRKLATCTVIVELWKYFISPFQSLPHLRLEGGNLPKVVHLTIRAKCDLLS